MAGGWLIAVLVEIAGEPAPLRHYFAVGHEDQGKAEWTAVDWPGAPAGWRPARWRAKSRWKPCARSRRRR